MNKALGDALESIDLLATGWMNRALKAEDSEKNLREMLEIERARTDQFDWETGECEHGLIGNYFTCNGKNGPNKGCERSRFLHCCACMKRDFSLRGGPNGA